MRADCPALFIAKGLKGSGATVFDDDDVVDHQSLEQGRDPATGSGNGRVRLAGDHFLRPRID